MLKHRSIRALLLILSLAFAACDRNAAEPRQLASSESAAPTPSLITGGQPAAEDLERLKALGVTQVINLRSSQETLPFDEPARAEALDMKYVSLPIAGAEAVTRENALALDRLLEGDEKTFLHCASGNRVGALLALRAFYVEKATPEEAMAVGRAAGLGSLADRVAYVMAGETADSR